MVKMPLISVVDDDDSVRESLRGLIRSVGFAVAVFASAEEFLSADDLRTTDCLILDVRMPGMNGLDLQRHLAATDYQIPVIFITAHGDEEARRRALQAAQWITCSNHSAKKRYSMQSTQLSLKKMEGSNGGLLKFDKGGETNMLETIGSGGSNQEQTESFPHEGKKTLSKSENGATSKAKPRVYVVDDDDSVRDAVGSLIRSAGLRVETFASAQEFLASS